MASLAIPWGPRHLISPDLAGIYMRIPLLHMSDDAALKKRAAMLQLLLTTHACVTPYRVRMPASLSHAHAALRGHVAPRADASLSNWSATCHVNGSWNSWFAQSGEIVKQLHPCIAEAAVFRRVHGI
jgi:hypothetical protein